MFPQCILGVSRTNKRRPPQVKATHFRGNSVGAFFRAEKIFMSKSHEVRKKDFVGDHQQSFVGGLC